MTVPRDVNLGATTGGCPCDIHRAPGRGRPPCLPSFAPRRTNLRPITGATTGGCPYDDRRAPGRGRPPCLPFVSRRLAERIWNPDNLPAEVAK